MGNEKILVIIPSTHCWQLYTFSEDAVTKDHELDGLKYHLYILSVLGVGSLKSRCPQKMVGKDPPLPLVAPGASSIPCHSLSWRGTTPDYTSAYL